MLCSSPHTWNRSFHNMSSVSVLLLVLFSALLADGQGCRSGFFPHGGSCYAVPGLVAEWAVAKMYCKAVGADLARVETSEENRFLINYLVTNRASLSNRRFWLDGCDFLKEGQWIWASSDENISSFHWSPGQPDNGGNQGRCLDITLGLGTDNSSDQLWHADSCGYHQGFICEYPQGSSHPQPIG